MSNRSARRVGAPTGLLFVVLSLFAGFIYPQQPRVDSPAATTLAWVKDNRVSLQAGMILGLFAAGAFLWFVGYLRTAFKTGEPGADALAPVVFGAGIAVAVIAVLGALPNALLAFMVAQPGGISDPSIVRMLGDLNVVLFAAASVVTAVFLLALGMSIVRRSLSVPTWLGWLSIVVAALNAIIVWLAVTFSTYHGKAWNVVAFGAFIGFLLVVLITSISFMRQPAAESAPISTAAVP
jgi:hypothetical protein